MTRKTEKKERKTKKKEKPGREEHRRKRNGKEEKHEVDSTDKKMWGPRRTGQIDWITTSTREIIVSGPCICTSLKID